MAASAPEAVTFSTALEGYARAFRTRLPAPALTEIRALGIDFDRLRPAYPMEAWERLLQLTGRALYPAEAPELALHSLGRDFIVGYGETVLGSAILAMSRVIGPLRSMQRLGRSLRTGGNFATVITRVLGPQEVEVVSALDPAYAPAWADRDMAMHPYRRGMFGAFLGLVGVRATVEMGTIDRQPQSATYRVSWTK